MPCLGPPPWPICCRPSGSPACVVASGSTPTRTTTDSTCRSCPIPRSSLHGFRPTAILIALDAYHLTAGITAGMDAPAAAGALTEMQDHIREIWHLARAAFRCPIIQQTALPLHLPVLGNNEHRLPGSRNRFTTRLNDALRTMAEAEGVDILAVDDRALRDGINKWHDTALWHRAKQEVSPVAAPMYGDLVGRWLAAKSGALVQVPRARPRQHDLGRRHRR